MFLGKQLDRIRRYAFSLDDECFVYSPEIDNYKVKVTNKAHETTIYLEQGFEWVGVKDSLIFLRKRK